MEKSRNSYRNLRSKVILLLSFLLIGFLSIYITTQRANTSLRNEI
jgi:hypothetical protein